MGYRYNENEPPSVIRALMLAERLIGFTVWGLGLGFGVQGLGLGLGLGGFRVWGLGCRVWGLGFRAYTVTQGSEWDPCRR